MTDKKYMKSILLIIVGIVFHYSAYSQVVVYPGPAGEPASTDYKVELNNNNLFVYQARVSAMAVNVWPCTVRPIEQSEIASFCSFDIEKEVTIKVYSKTKIKTVIIRPQSLNIKPVVNGNTISFKVTKPCQFVVEVNGLHKALHLFANPIEKTTYNKSGKNVLYFGPGIHYPGTIRPKNNQTIYIAAGAVVHGNIYAYKVNNLKIVGRGILDASTLVRDVDSLTILQLEQCQKVSIEGIILRDSHIWTLLAHECNDVEIDNIKIIGMWRYNADGIDIVNTKNVKIQNCFVRAFDDCIVMKGINNFYWAQHNPDWDAKTQSNVSNVVVKNCVIWNDWGRALEIGAETMADSIKHVLYQNIDIIHYVNIAMDIQNGNRANVSNVTYDNIRVEEPITNAYWDGGDSLIKDLDQEIKLHGNAHKLKVDQVGCLFEINVRDNGWVKDVRYGTVNNIVFKNIRYSSLNYIPTSLFEGYSPEHEIKNITFQNIYINGIKISDVSKANFSINEFVKNLYFKE